MLTDTKIRNLKRKDKLYRIADSQGLTLEINPNGSKLWRHRYRFNNKATMMSLGPYPIVTLLSARQARDKNKQLLFQGINPKQIKEEAKAKVSDKKTFEQMFLKWINKNKDQWSLGYVEDTIQRANNYLIPKLGNLPIDEIKSSEIRNLLLKIQDTGKLDMFKKVKGILNGVFKYSVGMDVLKVNPVRDLPSEIFKKKPEKHYAAITDPNEIPWLLDKLEEHKGGYEVRAALVIAPHVFLRPSELTGMLWSEVDFDAKLIRINKDRMKVKKTHLVPLSIQILKALKNLRNVNTDSDYVFPSPRNIHKPITPDSLRVALRSVGVGKDKMTTHGFRSMASTRLNELGYNADLIEIQLSHSQANKIRAAYNHAEYLEERITMMQEWSDYLDKLQNKESVSSLTYQQSLF
ncbi:tyrosine-type recombinase/integrase [Candidatus Thioglobus sp.]|nr:tyrosine-type recombinase/integrase [Candidatus Thioglobus sp.]MDA9060679.1 tyrosine-type recombinase/integrase [Candidatus Thioglobus sp.]